MRQLWMQLPCRGDSMSPDQKNYMMANGIISHYHVTQCDPYKGLEKENSSK